MDPHNAIQSVRQAIESSDVLRAVAHVKNEGGVAFALGDTAVHPLSDEQIRALEAAGNTADDWSQVQAADGFDPRRIRGCTFLGRVVLGSFDRPVQLDGLAVPSGVHNSTLADCIVGHNALVRDVRLLRRYVLAPQAIVWDVGCLSAGGESRFGNGVELPLAIESGGREVLIYAEITVDVAAAIARSRGNRGLTEQYEQSVHDYVAAATCPCGIVESGAVIRHTGRVVDTYVGPAARIENAVAVLSSALLSTADEPARVADGAFVEDSIIQWGSDAATGAIVQRSVLTEHSHVERHGKLTDSILGPNSGVAEGEVTASLLGPFVGFHHQALLIAALWPEGKGNVGYGANVGSNHTSKAPDQELWAGEGTFFGLGVNIKFPSDFTAAPYSIIATGVNALPQKVAFPFSLINSPAAAYPGISPAYNEIIPAWLLTDNMYTLKRNEGKYKARNKAKRTQFAFDVFRPDTVDLMLDARRRLQEVTETKDVYTDRDIPGLGKNYLLEPSRTRAIDAYHFYIAYYSLTQLKDRLTPLAASVSERLPADLLTQPSTDPAWEHARNLIQSERTGPNPWIGPEEDLPTLLSRLAEMQQKVAQAVEDSKRKDDTRGARIIPDYAAAHTPAEADKFVRQTREQTESFQNEISTLIAQLG